MRLSRKRFLSIAILTILSAAAYTQQASEQPTRSLLVNVFDRDGKPVRDLTKEKFRVRINGKSATVVNASYSLAPRRIVVVLDISGSMTDAGSAQEKWQIACKAVEDVLGETPPEVSIALLTFSDQVHDVFDFSQGRSSITAFLKQGSRRSKIKKRTALRDAILAGVKVLQPTRPGDSVYAITDGGDNASHVASIEITRILSESGVRLFAFLFAEYQAPTKEESLGPEELFEMAQDSGGFTFGVRDNCLTESLGRYPARVYGYLFNEDTRNKVKLCSRALSGFVNGFYTVQIEAPQLRKDAKIKLGIVDKTGVVRKDVRYTYPNLLTSKK